MSMNVLVISSSLRAGSNSDQLADAFVKGAKDAGHDVEKIQLKGKKISFCLGCLACQKTKTGHCIQKDDADDIIQKIKNADAVVFASPIYYYTLSGQLKTLLDRANPLYQIEYRFRDVYLLLSAAEDEETTPKRAVCCMEGWIDCFTKAKLAGTVFCGGVNDPNEINGSPKIQEAYQLGNHL